VTDLEPLKKIIAAATKGPMVLEEIDGKHAHDLCLGYEVPNEGSPILIATVFWDSEDDDKLIDLKQANANAKLIMHAWNTLPGLVAELEELRQRYCEAAQIAANSYTGFPGMPPDYESFL
jgi:hypothetical protein